MTTQVSIEVHVEGKDIPNRFFTEIPDDDAERWIYDLMRLWDSMIVYPHELSVSGLRYSFDMMDGDILMLLKSLGFYYAGDGNFTQRKYPFYEYSTVKDTPFGPYTTCRFVYLRNY